jgi:membrane protein
VSAIEAVGRRAARLARTFALKFAYDWSMNLASMIAYSLISAIFPILLAILSIAGIVLHAFASSADIDGLARLISGALPETQQGGIVIEPLLNNLIQITGPLGAVALVGLLWLGSNLFANIENAFSIIFRVRGRNLIAQRIMAIGMVLVLAVLLPLSLAATSLVAAGSDFFGAHLPPQTQSLLTYLGTLTSLGALWTLFLVIYLVVPNFEVRFHAAWPGALVASILFGLLQVLFPLYFKYFLTGNTRYGAAAASILVVIIWLWFFALITVIGAQINAVAIGLEATPHDLARTFELVYEEHDPSADAKRGKAGARMRRLRRVVARVRPPLDRRDN